MNEQMKNVMEMTSQTVGKDLLSALVQEVRLMPDVWVKLSQKKQDDVIERIRNRVETNVKMALHLLASEGRTVVTGDLDQITIKDGVKAVVKFGGSAANLHELYDAAGKAVLLVVANAQDHMGGMDEVKGEPDQRGMDLGQEYDPNGDGKGMDKGDVVDAEFNELPQLGHEPSSDEEDEQFEEGYQAAADGKPESDCPIMHGKLCIAWVKGHKHWHELQAQAGNDITAQTKVLKSKSGHSPNEHGVYHCKADQTLRFEAKGLRFEWELLELESGQWIYGSSINIKDGYSGSPMIARETFPNAAAIKEDILVWLNSKCEAGLFEALSLRESKRLGEFMTELAEQEDQSNTAEA